MGNKIKDYIYGEFKIEDVKAIKLAINTNELHIKDILKTDNEVIEILKKSKNNDLLNLVNSLNSDIKIRINENKYDIHIKGKLRLIDPSVYINNKVKDIINKDVYVEII